jgi:hypothetical protein
MRPVNHSRTVEFAADRRRRVARRRCGGGFRIAVAFGLVAAAALVGCHMTDRFAGHSAEYNVQAAAIKSQNLLVNILRAAHRRPLQFTDLTTVTGTSSLATGASFQLPFAGRANGGPRLLVFEPTVTETESPSFTVAVLNTKEFYEGILKPIPTQLLAYYLGIGMPRAMVMTLAIAEIDYGRPDAIHRIYNRPNSTTAPAYDQFQKLLGDLLDLGLNVEAVEEHTAIGAPFDQKSLPDPKDAIDLEAKGVKAVRHELNDPAAPLAPEQRARFRSAGYFYQLERTKVAYRFCFDRMFTRNGKVLQAGMPIGDTGEVVEAAAICNSGAGQAVRATAPPPQPAGESTLQVGAPGAAGGRATPSTSFAFSVRSTEAVIYYLGELMRHDLALVPPQMTPLITSDPNRNVLFHIAPGAGKGDVIGAEYEGRRYHIVADPSGGDRSSQILDLLTELLAQNNSAKDLPAPSVIPILPR